MGEMAGRPFGSRWNYRSAAYDTAMRWDLAFYVKNLPPEYRCHDDGFMMVGVSDPHIEMLAEGTRDLQGVQQFFPKRRCHNLRRDLPLGG